MGDLESAWAAIRKAAGNSIYHAEEEFAALPSECQRAVGSADRLRAIGTDDSEDAAGFWRGVVMAEYASAARTANFDTLTP